MITNMYRSLSPQQVWKYCESPVFLRLRWSRNVGTHHIVFLKKRLRGVIHPGVVGILPLLLHFLTVTLQDKKDVVWLVNVSVVKAEKCFSYVLLTYHTDLNHFPWTSWCYCNCKSLCDKQRNNWNKKKHWKNWRKITCSFTWFWLCPVDDTHNQCQHCS